MHLQRKRVVVVGGSRGLGLGLVEAFVVRDAEVSVVARNASGLQVIGQRLPVTTISADATRAGQAKKVMEESRPEIVILNAGAEPPMERIDQIDWEAFTQNWNVSVR